METPEGGPPELKDQVHDDTFVVPEPIVSHPVLRTEKPTDRYTGTPQMSQRTLGVT